MRVVEVCLLLCILNIGTLLTEDCATVPECHVFNWRPWSPCIGACGSQSQYRIRYLCCPASVQPHTLNNCLGHCGKSSTFSSNMTKPCRICENGGTFSISSKSCQCDPYHKGICCNDVVTCQDQPCKHGRCTDQGASFMCTCDERYTGVTCDSLLVTEETSELLLPVWLPFLECALLIMVSLTGIMVLGCLCLKCCQALGVIRHNDVDDDKANRQKHKGDLIVLQNRPKPIGYNSHMETEF